jgi:hypothetical protein
VWHELVLAGIGGATVAEAKQRLQYVEFLDWLTYRRMRGSLNMGSRMESGFALIASLISSACGGNAKPVDFMPHADAPAASLDDVMGILSGKQR